MFRQPLRYFSRNQNKSQMIKEFEAIQKEKMRSVQESNILGTFNKSVRVRFAPSPTGELHVGGLRSMLYNYLFAKQFNGELILRIEDTDKSREVEGAVDRLVEAMKWTGLTWQEGPGGTSTNQKTSFRTIID